MKHISFTVDIVVHDEDTLIDSAVNLYRKVWSGDLADEMELYDKDKKIIRSIFEVLMGSAPLPYQYNDVGIEVVGFDSDSKPKEIPYVR